MAKRHADWSHVLVVGGDYEAAAPYLPEARKLLGMVKDDAAYNDLMTHQMVRHLDDGTTIVAEMHGDIPRMTISPTSEETESMLGKLGDFVVWARDASLPDGIDPTKPQQILRKHPKSGWRTYAARSGLPGRADATYGGRFLQGIRRAGNIDWEGPDKERISWYGPSSRVWLDAYVNPRAQYGKFVFMLGQALLDVDAYIAESDPEPAFADRWVLGAAIKKIDGVAWLYTVQSTCMDGATDMTPLPPMEGRLSPPTTDNMEVSTFYRYRLLQSPDAAGVQRYRVVAGSRAELGSISNVRNEPWVFDSKCTVAHCYELPGYGAGGDWFADTYHSSAGNPPDALPAPAQNRFRISIGEDGDVALAGVDPLSLRAGGAAVQVATDYVEGGPVHMTFRLGADLVAYIGMGGLELPLWQVSPDGPDTTGTKRYLLHANVRDQVLVFLTDNLIFDAASESPGSTTRGDGTYIEVYFRGQRIAKQVLYPVGQRPRYGGSQFYSSTADTYRDFVGKDIAPFFYVYGAMVQRAPAVGSTFGTNVDFTGCNTSYASWQHNSSCYFGTYDHAANVAPTPRPPTRVSDLAVDGFSNSRLDFDGHYSLTGAQASEDTLLLSCSVLADDNGPSFNLVSDPGATLATLTGVGGGNQRYHPIWRLGDPPKPVV